MAGAGPGKITELLERAGQPVAYLVHFGARRRRSSPKPPGTSPSTTIPRLAPGGTGDGAEPMTQWCILPLLSCVDGSYRESAEPRPHRIPLRPGTTTPGYSASRSATTAVTCAWGCSGGRGAGAVTLTFSGSVLTYVALAWALGSWPPPRRRSRAVAAIRSP